MSKNSSKSKSNRNRAAPTETAPSDDAEFNIIAQGDEFLVRDAHGTFVVRRAGDTHCEVSFGMAFRRIGNTTRALREFLNLACPHVHAAVENGLPDTEEDDFILDDWLEKNAEAA